MTAIGIDLGTTNSCVAALEDGEEEVYQNDNGKYVTPSCVAFTKKQTLIGETAKRCLVEEPENTVFSVKRIIGRKFDDPKTQQDIKRWQFKVVRSESGMRPLIKIDHREETYSPEEISGLVLGYMRRIACRKLDEDVRDAVVTVPAYFNHMQRTATKTAAEIAGLNVLGIINEPTAAAIAFGLLKQCSEKHNILVYDFGGGTIDVTILSIEGSQFDVKASSGETRLGGDDFTNRLVDYFVQYLATELGTDIKEDKCAMNKLWLACEDAKKELSFVFEHNLFIDKIADGVTLKRKINRHKFVSLNKDLFEKTMHCVDDAIKESGVNKEDIHFVVPVGGSSRIPYVREKLENYFSKEIVKEDKSPEQAISRGAAVYAAYLKGQLVQQMTEVRLSEVTSLSFGVRVEGYKSSVLIRRNNKLPVTISEYYTNTHSEQKVANIKVCQGEEKWFDSNEYLGEFNLAITPKPKGQVKIDVEFTLDLSGILHVKATETEAGQSTSTKIDLCSTLEKLNISELTRKLEELASEEERYKVLEEAKYELESTADEIKNRSKPYPQVVERCKQITKWVEENEDVKLFEVQQKKEEILKLEEAAKKPDRRDEFRIKIKPTIRFASSWSSK